MLFSWAVTEGMQNFFNLFHSLYYLFMMFTHSFNQLYYYYYYSLILLIYVFTHRYEDGTVSFLSIAALRHGFDTLNRFNLNMETVSKHTFHLAQLTYQKMTRLRHENGQALAVLYGKTDYTDRRRQGGIVTFNLLRSNGSYIGYSEVSLHLFSQLCSSLAFLSHAFIVGRQNGLRVQYPFKDWLFLQSWSMPGSIGSDL